MATRFRALRRRLGYNQQGMAAMAGVAQVSWSEWERKAPKQFGHLARLALRAGVSAEWLLGLTDDPTPGRRAGALREEPAGYAVWREWEGDVVAAAAEMTAGQRGLWLRIGAAIVEEEREARAQEELRAFYVRMIDALADEPARAALDEALGLARAGDRAAAVARVEAFFGQGAAEEAAEEELEDV